MRATDKEFKQMASTNFLIENQSPNSVSTSPMGDEPQQNGCGPLQSIGILGAKLKSSTSLHNLEITTKDSLRNVVDKTANMGENMKHKYGSRMNVSRGKYDKFKDDPDSDEENS